MRRTAVVAVAVGVVAVAAIAMRGRHPRATAGAGVVRPAGGVLSPTGAAFSTASSRPAATAASTTSTPSLPPSPPSSAQVAAAVVAAYVNGPVSGRRARCRPYDTAALDAELGQPTWTGGGTASDPGPAAVSVGAPVLVDDTAAGRGYEITVNGVAGVKAASVYVVATPGGGWLAESIALS